MVYFCTDFLYFCIDFLTIVCSKLLCVLAETCLMSKTSGQHLPHKNIHWWQHWVNSCMLVEIQPSLHLSVSFLFTTTLSARHLVSYTHLVTVFVRMNFYDFFFSTLTLLIDFTHIWHISFYICNLMTSSFYWRNYCTVFSHLNQLNYFAPNWDDLLWLP